MESIDQPDYFRRRAEEERVAAASAQDERAAKTHRSLAARYEAKANGAPVRALGGEQLDEGGTPSNDFTILP